MTIPTHICIRTKVHHLEPLTALMLHASGEMELQHPNHPYSFPPILPALALPGGVPLAELDTFVRGFTGSGSRLVSWGGCPVGVPARQESRKVPQLAAHISPRADPMMACIASFHPHGRVQ